MKIAELETHHDICADLGQRILVMVDNHEFPAVFSVCIESFPSIVPAMAYRKKKGILPDMPGLSAFSTICRYAPPLFEHSAIESLSDFIKSTRILAQSENNVLEWVEAARKREQVARAIWNCLEKHPEMLQCDICADLEVSREEAVDIIELWEELGILDRRPDAESHRLYFRTRLDAEVAGLCPRCGVQEQGRKDSFFQSGACRQCKSEGHHYIEYAVLHS